MTPTFSVVGLLLSPPPPPPLSPPPQAAIPMSAATATASAATVRRAPRRAAVPEPFSMTLLPLAAGPCRTAVVPPYRLPPPAPPYARRLESVSTSDEYQYSIRAVARSRSQYPRAGAGARTLG